MNMQCKGYKFKKKKKMTPHLAPYAGLGRHSLVVSEPRFRRLLNRVYMIEKPVFSNVLA